MSPNKKPPSLLGWWLELSFSRGCVSFLAFAAAGVVAAACSRGVTASASVAAKFLAVFGFAFAVGARADV